MRWTFEHTGSRSGAFNMQYDEQLARAVAIGERSSTVRVYGWNPPAISYGWNQALDDIDVLAAERAGIDVVRRPTGGRAILHSEELTYSVVMAAGQQSITEMYRDISEALVCGLRNLGIDAALEKSQPDFVSHYRTSSGAACFSSTARHEIKVNGRKLVGSAQRRFSFGGKEVLLQHGSILVGKDHLRIVDFLKFDSDAERNALRVELSSKTTEINSILSAPINVDEVAEAVRQGFEEKWKIVFTSSNQQAYAAHTL